MLGWFKKIWEKIQQNEIYFIYFKIFISLFIGISLYLLFPQNDNKLYRYINRPYSSENIQPANQPHPFKCVNGKIDTKYQPLFVKLENVQSYQINQTVQVQPIKIVADYSNFIINKQTNKEIYYNKKAQNSEYQQKHYLQYELIPQAIDYLGEFLRMERSYIIKMPNPQCNWANVPEIHIQNGVDAHIILYISNTYEVDEEYLFWSKICVRDQLTKAPLAFQLNINLNQLKIGQDSHGFNLQALIHELTHGLAFSIENIKQFDYDPMTIAPTGIKVSNPNQMYFKFNQNPSVKYLQKYFNCSKLDRLPIQMKHSDDNQDTLHWDRISLMNDLMTSNILPNTDYSNFNLMVYEASNWYKIDEDIFKKKVQKFEWGKNQGCDFIYNFDEFYKKHANKTLSLPYNFGFSEDLQKENYIQHKKHLKTETKKKNKQMGQYLINSYNLGARLEGFCDSLFFNNIEGGCSYDYTYFAICSKDKYSKDYSYLIPSFRGSCQNQQFNSHTFDYNVTGETFSIQSRCVISDITFKGNQLSGQKKTLMNSKNNPLNNNNRGGGKEGDTKNTNNPNNNLGLLSQSRCYEAICDIGHTKIYFNIKIPIKQSNFFNEDEQLYNEFTLICENDNEIITNPEIFEGSLKCPLIKQFCHFSADNSCPEGMIKDPSKQYCNRNKTNCIFPDIC